MFDDSKEIRRKIKRERKGGGGMERGRKRERDIYI